jgi:hypothetical protein
MVTCPAGVDLAQRQPVPGRRGRFAGQAGDRLGAGCHGGLLSRALDEGALAGCIGWSATAVELAEVGDRFAGLEQREVERAARGGREVAANGRYEEPLTDDAASRRLEIQVRDATRRLADQLEGCRCRRRIDSGIPARSMWVRRPRRFCYRCATYSGSTRQTSS